MNIAMSLVSFTVPLLLGVAFKRRFLDHSSLWFSSSFPAPLPGSTCTSSTSALGDTSSLALLSAFSTILLCGSHHPSLHRYLVQLALLLPLLLETPRLWRCSRLSRIRSWSCLCHSCETIMSPSNCDLVGDCHTERCHRICGSKPDF